MRITAGKVELLHQARLVEDNLIRRFRLRTRAGWTTWTLIDSLRIDWHGQTRMNLVVHQQGIIYQGENFCGSPLHSDDSDATCMSVVNLALHDAQAHNAALDMPVRHPRVDIEFILEGKRTELARQMRWRLGDLADELEFEAMRKFGEI